MQDDLAALMFPGAKGGPIRRSGFNTAPGGWTSSRRWACRGSTYDLRHTGNMLGAGLKDLMARMGHDDVRAAMIHQHAVRGADEAITNAIDRQLGGRDDDEGHCGRTGPGRLIRS